MGKVKTHANKKKAVVAPVDRTARVILSDGVYTVWNKVRRIASHPIRERAIYLASKRGYTIAAE